ncbi:sugar phosphate isomerase/epimerase family protein [Planctomycetota bacterium]
MKPTGLHRRSLLKAAVAGAAWTLSQKQTQAASSASTRSPIRLGGPVFDSYEHPEQWVSILRGLGYRAAYCPVKADASDDVVEAYAMAAKKANIVIAEVGAWSNPLSQDEEERQAALTRCRTQLELADRIGANCCVNISGSRGEHWAGPHQDNLTSETFDMIVEVTRSILDDVQPTRTYFTLEAMPWSYPDSPDAYVRLLKAIDRKRFAVHLDPMNLIVSPQVYYRSGAMIRECFAKLGPHIRSCHAKDIQLNPKILTPQLTEVRAGLGEMDYAAFLTELSKTGDIPLMMEHLPNNEEYQLAAKHIRTVGKSNGCTFL